MAVKVSEKLAKKIEAAKAALGKAQKVVAEKKSILNEYKVEYKKVKAEEKAAK